MVLFLGLNTLGVPGFEVITMSFYSRAGNDAILLHYIEFILALINYFLYLNLLETDSLNVYRLADTVIKASSQNRMPC